VRWIPLLIVLTGCPWTAPTPLARVYHGPAFRAPAQTLAALPVVCATEPELCTPAHAAAVANATRMTLEFAGYSVVDSELLNAEMRRRTTKAAVPVAARAPDLEPAAQRNEFRPPPNAIPDESEVSGGVTWTQASPAQQQDLLGAIGVDAVLQTRVGFGVAHGLSGQRTITVSMTVSRLDAAVVWASSCDVETGDYHSNEQAIELATRCALESATLW
jgi:hypothetical protein